MASASQIEAQNAYADIMREISQRLYWLDYLLNGRTGINQLLIRDSGYLQVRLICELIALGCLIVHGDIPATREPQLQKEWSAGAILAALNELHPNFFPQAHQLQSVRSGEWHFAERENTLDRAALASLYGRCGGWLHRGTALKLRKAAGVQNLGLDELREASSKLKMLLEAHSIALLDENTRFVGLMQPSLEGKFEVAIGEASNA